MLCWISGYLLMNGELLTVDLIERTSLGLRVFFSHAVVGSIFDTYKLLFSIIFHCYTLKLS